MARVLVIGARGMLGASLCPRLQGAGHELLRQSRAVGLDLLFDPLDARAWLAVLTEHRPAAVVNLAAATDVDRCERDPRWAYDANVGPVIAFVHAARECGVLPHLLHISTDHVYDGEGPHREDGVTLTNTYALTKYAGELAALRVPATVLRTNFFGPSRCAGRASFTDWLLHGLRGRQPLKVFDDVLFSPLSMATLGRAICVVLRAPVEGVFNLGATDGMSKADFAFAFAQALELPTVGLERTTTDRVDFLKTYRPKDMRMDSAAFEAAFNLRLPPLMQELQLTCKEYRREPAPART